MNKRMLRSVLAAAVAAVALIFGAAGSLDVGWATPDKSESAASQVHTTAEDVGWGVVASDVGWAVVAGADVTGDVGWQEPTGVSA